MIRRPYGRTGMTTSVIGFGGMRFPDDRPQEYCEDLMLSAFRSGITLFDTAPGYGRSELVFGKGLAKIFAEGAKREDVTVSTKTMARTPKDARLDIRRSLMRMKLDHVDILHCWCVMDMDDYGFRKTQGVLDELAKIKADGLARHISVSTHMEGADMHAMFDDYGFEGVLMGYSAQNFAYREQGIRSAAERGLGVLIMNPLAGGAIPQNPERFEYLKETPEETPAQAALRFLINDPDITAALAGFSTEEQIKEAAQAAEGFTPRSQETLDRIRSASAGASPEERLCTGCKYCMPCPYGVPIPKMMDAYNRFMLEGKRKDAIKDRLYWHWHIEADDRSIRSCRTCGACEKKCTQKLPIVRRIAEVVKAADAALK